MSDGGTLTSYCSKQYRSQAERLLQACKKRTKPKHAGGQWGDDNCISKQEEKLNSGITFGGKDTFTGVEQQSSAQSLQVGPADAAHGLRMQQFKPRSLGRAEQLLVSPVAEVFAHLQLQLKRLSSLRWCKAQITSVPQVGLYTRMSCDRVQMSKPAAAADQVVGGPSGMQGPGAHS